MAENGDHDDILGESGEIEHNEEVDETNYDEEAALKTVTEAGEGDAVDHDESGVEDPELESIKARVREMEEEAEKLKAMQDEVEKQMNMSSPGLTSPISKEDKESVDARSIYVGNVDYGSTAEELEAHFHGCGSVNRVTILCDKFSGHPKGFAYIEFADKDSVQTSLALDESLFRGRQIKVSAKRTNVHGISTTNRGRGRGFRGRGRGSFYSGFRRSRPFRPRRSAWFSPY